MLEDFYFKGEDPLKVFKSSAKSIIMILPYILLVIGMFVSIALTADESFNCVVGFSGKIIDKDNLSIRIKSVIHDKT